jgi:DNA ligase D-like protein (predicted 3'-phosphoesterase)
MAVKPPVPGNERGKAHPRMHGDACLLRQHLDRAERTHRQKSLVEGRAYDSSLPDEMLVEVTERRTGVRLVWIGEAATALRTHPHPLMLPVASCCTTKADLVHPDSVHEGERPAFVLHEHERPRHHFDLRLEEGGALRSWAVPRGLPTTSRQNRLAVEVADHELDHLTYEDETKHIADIGWWEEHDRNERRMVFTLHGRSESVRYALIRTEQDWLLRRTTAQPDDPARS